jgi:hypothetical protein
MAAPKGNQFWNPEFPGGRPPKFKSPEDLWEKCCDYFKMVDESPMVSKEHTSSDKFNSSKTVEHKLPYTWEGLYVFLNVCDLEHYKTKEEFSKIITHIRHCMFNQKLSGAAAGIFNSNIIARELGLADKRDTTINDQRKKTSELFPDEDELDG